MSRNLSQATSAIRRVRSSTYQDPPAGSTTEARALSSNSSNWVLRAVRRPNSLGRPRPESKGRTVTASAPPTPAAKAATVPRSKLPHGSRQVRSTVDPLACWTWPQCSSVAPLASATRAHSRRAARSRQMVRNWSASADQVKEIWSRASSTVRPWSTNARSTATPTAVVHPSSRASLAPASAYTVPSNENARTPGRSRLRSTRASTALPRSEPPAVVWDPPCRAATPIGSRPRRPARSPDAVLRRSHKSKSQPAAVTPSGPGNKATVAISRCTPASTASRSSRDSIPMARTSNRTEVEPRASSSNTVALAAATPRSETRARTSQPVAV